MPLTWVWQALGDWKFERRLLLGSYWSSIQYARRSYTWKLWSRCQLGGLLLSVNNYRRNFSILYVLRVYSHQTHSSSGFSDKADTSVVCHRWWGYHRSAVNPALFFTTTSNFVRRIPSLDSLFFTGVGVGARRFTLHAWVRTSWPMRILDPLRPTHANIEHVSSKHVHNSLCTICILCVFCVWSACIMWIYSSTTF